MEPSTGDTRHVRKMFLHQTTALNCLPGTLHQNAEQIEPIFEELFRSAR